MCVSECRQLPFVNAHLVALFSGWGYARTAATTPLALYTQGGPQTGAMAQLAGWRRTGQATWAGALSICLQSLFIRLSLLEATQCNTPC